MSTLRPNTSKLPLLVACLTCFGVMLGACGSGTVETASPVDEPLGANLSTVLDPQPDTAQPTGLFGFESGSASNDPTPPTISNSGADANVVATQATTTPQSSTTVSSTTAASSTSPETTQAEATDQSMVTSATEAGASNETREGEDSLESGEIHSFNLLNELRVGMSLEPLASDPDMDEFARDWSKQMAESGAFEHSQGPYAENIAFISDISLSAAEAAEAFHEMWINSPGHYANMVNESYTRTGVGLYKTERGWYGTQVFLF